MKNHLVIKYTAEQSRKQEEVVEQLLLQGYTTVGSIRKVCQKHFEQQFGLTHKVSHERIKSLVERVRKRWEEQISYSQTDLRSAALQRSYGVIRKAHAKEDLDLVLEAEKHVAKIEGTYAPLKISASVEVKHALVQVIGNMTVEQINQTLDEFHQKEALIEEARNKGFIPDKKPKVLTQ
jgi:hypothetical protein